ncbi:restriction endonuclease subunit S [Bacillus cereus]|uniref:restriction endonuclease subunit S n=1 Tax=Bacillus cereus TaxID=1396 RepID=UPI00119D7571|nr:restriction endonuclease subunit S [Bacillus cereus]
MSKKKQTIEELVEEALISEEEQPYVVPVNWIWTKLGSVFEPGKEQIQPTGNEKYIGLEHLNKGGGILEVGNTEGVKSKKVVFKTNDVLYGKLRPYLNKHAHVDFEGVASTDILVYRNKNILTNKLLNMYLDLPHVLQYANENSNGINLPRVSPKSMDVLSFPLPPLNEQKRIVEKAERLLNKIEEAKQLIEEAKETFELRRAAILDKAFRGELTRKWRRENSKTDGVFDYLSSLKNITNFKGDGDVLEPYSLPFGWKWSRIGDLFHVQVGTTPSRKNEAYWEGQYPWLSSGEVQFNNINESRECVTDLAVKERKLKLAPKGSILFGMIGEGKTRGQVALLNIDAFHNQNIASIWVSETKINSFYVYHWLMSQYMKNRQNSAGSNQPAYNKSRVQNLLIPIPPLDEVDVIVNELEKLLGLEKEINILLSLEGKISDIKQSIFSKAFRGELGTNDPSEENAIELLKEILQEQVK